MLILTKYLKLFVVLSIAMQLLGTVSFAQDTSESLPDTYIFGEYTTPKNRLGTTAGAEFMNDGLIGEEPNVPEAMRPTGNTASPTLNFSKLRRSANNNPGAAPAGVSAGESGAQAASNIEVASVSQIATADHPVEALVATGYNKELVEKFTELSDLATAYYAAGAADPLYKDVLSSSYSLGSSFNNNVYQARERQNSDLEQAGAAGKMRLYGVRNCENQAALTGGKGEEAKGNYPALACIMSRDGAGLAGSTNPGGFDLSMRSNVAKANTRAKTRAGTPEVDPALQSCGFSEQSVMTDAAKCDYAGFPTGGGEVLYAIRNSYLLYPDDPGAPSDEQTKKREEYQRFFGDQCQICIRGGKDELGRELASSSIRTRTKKIPPSENLGENFNKINMAVYDNLRKILFNKCYHDNFDHGSVKGPAATEAKGSEIFRLAPGETTGLTPELYNDGNFWFGDAASGTNPDNKLGGGISAKEALDYLSFDGFKLTPAVMDGLYDIITEKNSITESGIAHEKGGYKNDECDRRLGANLAWDRIHPILSDSKSPAAMAVGREIRALYSFARRLTLGKIFDGCQQAMTRAQTVTLMPEFAEQAVQAIGSICTGNMKDPSAFINQRAENIQQIYRFVDRLFEELARGSGKSGSAVAKAFKGDRSQN